MARSCSINYASLSYPTIFASINVGGSTSSGIVWSYTSSSPTISSNNGSAGGGGGSGTYIIDGNVSCGNAHCYVKGYATDGGGYTYSVVVDVGATQACPAVPTVSTTALSSITFSGASGGGNVTNGGYPSGANPRGVCWNTSTNPTTANSHTSNGSGLGSFSSILTGLADNTIYYVRAYAINSTGTGYGGNVTGKTLSRPILTTKAISGITEISAISGGIISFSGTSAVTAKGICWNTSANPTTGNTHISAGSGIGSFNITITGISQNNSYYVRAYAVNTLGISYGNQQTFSIPITAPSLTGGSKTNTFPNIGWSGKTQVSTWTGCTIQRWYNKVSGGSYSLIATLGKATGNTYNLTTLLPNLNYQFYTIFSGATGVSPNSNVITIKNSVSNPTDTFSTILLI